MVSNILVERLSYPKPPHLSRSRSLPPRGIRKTSGVRHVSLLSFWTEGVPLDASDGLLGVIRGGIALTRIGYDDTILVPQSLTPLVRGLRVDFKRPFFQMKVLQFDVMSGYELGESRKAAPSFPPCDDTLGWITEHPYERSVRIYDPLGAIPSR